MTVSATQQPSRKPHGEKGQQEENPLTHEWVVDATIDVDEKTARYANFRGSFRTKAQQRIDVLDVRCKLCRRSIDDVADQPCEAKIDNSHLIGGPIGERKKRKRGNIDPNAPGCELVQAPKINRFGVEAYMNG
ncbi:hypothetical protein LI90_3272 [Carbonactinospora thermoautotrophica]|uniref:Uncharacterized protein n=1 Tax=Carbonactinospora thermoautotrophica TaxID=1469144 RepID=A0A132MWI6_9ACTN|nr:hypothetical protein [Carbonactinospora thermoautotrophica]KWX02229.1 hypothetical protein LI90_3272 [Carbonactinospora thermoautotrophica]